MKFLVCCLISTAAAFAQERNPPQIPTCKSDLAAWREGYSADLASSAMDILTKNLSAGQLANRIVYLDQCEKLDPATLGYRVLANVYLGAFSDRQWKFLIRHGLVEQFSREDASNR